MNNTGSLSLAVLPVSMPVVSEWFDDLRMFQQAAQASRMFVRYQEVMLACQDRKVLNKPNGQTQEL